MSSVGQVCSVGHRIIPRETVWEDTCPTSSAQYLHTQWDLINLVGISKHKFKLYHVSQMHSRPAQHNWSLYSCSANAVRTISANFPPHPVKSYCSPITDTIMAALHKVYAANYHKLINVRYTQVCVVRVSGRLYLILQKSCIKPAVTHLPSDTTKYAFISGLCCRVNEIFALLGW